MPKKEITDYIIYKIICNDENIKDCYVGSTSNFKVRKNNHKCKCNIVNSKIYKTIRENGGWDNWSMIPIAEYKQISFVESRIKEEEYRVNLEAKLNTISAFTNKETRAKNDKEYRETNKQKIYEKKKLYRENNRQKINEYQSEWRKKKKILLG